MNPVAFTVGPLEIRWYSLCILAAALTGLFVMEKEAGRFGIRKDFIFNMMFWVFIFCSCEFVHIILLYYLI